MELREIRTFLQIAQKQSFSKAAEALGYSQAAVTVQIKQLEEEISALESEESDINAQLALPEIAADYARLSERCKRLEEVKSALDNLYEEYETLI